MKRVFNTVINLAFLCSFCFGNSSFHKGGYDLIMTSETHLLATRLVGDLKADLTNLNSILENLLYKSVKGERIRRKEVILQEDVKKNLDVLTTRMAKHFTELNMAFKSAYFVSEPSASYNKKFSAIKSYQRNVKMFADTKDLKALPDIFKEGQGAELNMVEITSFVKNAKIKAAEFITEKQKTMTVWQWLFGY